MKINIIHSNKTNVMTDVNLSYIFKRFKQKPSVQHIHTNSYKSNKATVNIFENINFYQMSKAKFNVLFQIFIIFIKLV